MWESGNFNYYSFFIIIVFFERRNNTDKTHTDEINPGKTETHECYWPSDEILAKIEESGCHVVPKPSSTSLTAFHQQGKKLFHSQIKKKVLKKATVHMKFLLQSNIEHLTS